MYGRAEKNSLIDFLLRSGYDDRASGWSGDRGPVFTGSRKVRTPQSTASDNARGGETSFGVNLPDKGHRNKLRTHPSGQGREGEKVV